MSDRYQVLAGALMAPECTTSSTEYVRLILTSYFQYFLLHNASVTTVWQLKAPHDCCYDGVL